MVQALMKRFANVLAKIQKQHNGAVLQLGTGVQVSELQLLEQHIGVALPQSLQEMYLTHNGQMDGSDNVFNRETWLTLAQMQEAWQQMQEQASAKADVSVNAMDDEVQALWWHAAWLPFVSDVDGHYVCVDLAPTSDGEVGQIIRVSSTQAVRALDAESLEVWLENHIEALEESDYVYSAKHGGIVDAEVLFAEEENDMFEQIPPLSREQWEGMENDLQNTLNDLLGEGAPDLKSLVSGLLEDDEVKAIKPSEQAATAPTPSFKALFDEPQNTVIKRPETTLDIPSDTSKA